MSPPLPPPLPPDARRGRDGCTACVRVLRNGTFGRVAEAAPCARFGRCVAKRKCFAPAALYKPFGEQAAGVNSLARFRALQQGEQELASLRELGLTEQEVELWRTRDLPQGEGKVRALRQMVNVCCNITLHSISSLMCSCQVA